MTERRVARYRTAVRALWGAGVLVVILGSLLPSSSAPLQLLEHLALSDKLIHFAAYAGLAFIPGLHENRRTLFLLCLGLVGVGVGLEFGQLESPGRTFEIADMLADGAGVLLGALAAVPLRARLLPRLTSKPAPEVETLRFQVR